MKVIKHNFIRILLHFSRSFDAVILNNLIKLNFEIRKFSDKNEFEFWVEYQSKKAIFVVKDTASNFQT